MQRLPQHAFLHSSEQRTSVQALRQYINLPVCHFVLVEQPVDNPVARHTALVGAQPYTVALEGEAPVRVQHLAPEAPQLEGVLAHNSG